jgi:two-component system OmpR family sensor kinase
MAGSDAQGGVAAPLREGDKDRLIADLHRRVDELTAALAARDNFLTIAAHELRNPMTPIIGQVQRLRRQVTLRACSLEEVERSIGLIHWLIELYLKRATTLLDVSRITTGKLRLEITDVMVPDLVRGLTAMLEPAVQHVGSTLTVAVEDGLVVRVDRLALEQILDNLLLNAIKYGNGKPIEVAAFSDRETFRLQVRDHGIGMSQADQQRIFEPFERAIAYDTAAGFGVGLWVVRQLVDAMAGSIRIESTPDVGTTFTVTLPRNVMQEP